MSNNDFWMGYTAGSGNVQIKYVDRVEYVNVYIRKQDTLDFFDLSRMLLSLYLPDEYNALMEHTRIDSEDGNHTYKNADAKNWFRYQVDSFTKYRQSNEDYKNVRATKEIAESEARLKLMHQQHKALVDAEMAKRSNVELVEQRIKQREIAKGVLNTIAAKYGTTTELEAGSIESLIAIVGARVDASNTLLQDHLKTSKPFFSGGKEWESKKEAFEKQHKADSIDKQRLLAIRESINELSEDEIKYLNEIMSKYVENNSLRNVANANTLKLMLEYVESANLSEYGLNTFKRAYARAINCCALV